MKYFIAMLVAIVATINIMHAGDYQWGGGRYPRTRSIYQGPAIETYDTPKSKLMRARKREEMRRDYKMREANKYPFYRQLEVAPREYVTPAMVEAYEQMRSDKYFEPIKESSRAREYDTAYAERRLPWEEIYGYRAEELEDAYASAQPKKQAFFTGVKTWIKSNTPSYVMNWYNSYGMPKQNRASDKMTVKEAMERRKKHRELEAQNKKNQVLDSSNQRQLAEGLGELKANKPQQNLIDRAR